MQSLMGSVGYCPHVPGCLRCKVGIYSMLCFKAFRKGGYVKMFPPEH